MFFKELIHHTRILIENGEYTFESESIARNNTGFESNTKIKFSTENKELFFSLPIFMKEIKWNPKIPFELSIYQTSSNDGKEFFKNSLYCRHNLFLYVFNLHDSNQNYKNHLTVFRKPRLKAIKQVENIDL